MRVVHLTSLHPPDDVRIFHKECRSLAQAGFDVHLVAPGAVEGTRDGVAIHGFVLPGGPRPVRIVRRWWRAWSAAHAVQADLCHFHEPELVPIALLLKLRGTQIVYDVHEDHLSTLEYSAYSGVPRRIGFWLFERLARRVCDGFVAVTPAIAHLLPRERTVQVRNYPLREVPEVAPSAGGRSLDAVYVGGLTRDRGVLEMVAVAGSLRHDGARVVLIGSFDTPELEAEARALPGWQRIEYLGRLSHDEVRKRLATSRVGLVILHPVQNYLRSLPTKLFEYMAAGLPAVVSDFPFFRELLDPIGCAVYVDPLDPQQIAAAVDDLLEDEGRTGEMGRRGDAAVRERLNWRCEAAKLVELYKRLEQASI